MKDLENKFITGVSWSFIQQIVTYITVFIFGIILARLLSPEEFGMVGIVGIFLGILPLFVDGGFANALKQRKQCTDDEYSTVFYFNVVMSIFLYVILFFSSEKIAEFFNNDNLVIITRVLGLNLIISSLYSIQNVILSRQLNFKLIAKVTLITQIVSGIIAVFAAFLGFGIWALIIRSLLNSLLITLLYYTYNKWKPKLFFSFKIIKGLFSYGSKLLLGSLINVLFNNAFMFVIGKFYSAAQLGYYTRAYNFSMLPSQNLTMVVHKVAFPAFSQFQDNEKSLLAANRKIMRLLMFASSILMVGLAASAEAFVISLVGEKWRPSIIYLQILCFSVLLLPAHSVNVNILNVVGRSDLSLKLVIIKNTLMIPIIITGIYFGIIHMLLGMVLYSFTVFFINTVWANSMIGYNIKKQLLDIIPSFFIAIIVGVLTYSSSFLPFNYIIILLIQIGIGLFSTIIICETIKYSPYLELKEILNKLIYIPIVTRFF